MIEQSLGIVLRSFFPHKVKLSLLTEDLGKISIMPDPQYLAGQLSPGVIISCALRPFSHSIYIASQVEIIRTIHIVNYEMLQFVHQLLEICYYFLPALDQPGDLFVFLQKVLCLVESQYLSLGQQAHLEKLSIIALLSRLGFYPKESLREEVRAFEVLLGGSVDFRCASALESLHKAIEHAQDKRIALYDEWISRCLERHPHRKYFKAIRCRRNVESIQEK